MKKKSSPVVDVGPAPADVPQAPTQPRRFRYFLKSGQSFDVIADALVTNEQNQLSLQNVRTPFQVLDQRDITAIVEIGAA